MVVEITLVNKWYLCQGKWESVGSCTLIHTLYPGQRGCSSPLSTPLAIPNNIIPNFLWLEGNLIQRPFIPFLWSYDPVEHSPWSSTDKKLQAWPAHQKSYFKILYIDKIIPLIPLLPLLLLIGHFGRGVELLSELESCKTPIIVYDMPYQGRPGASGPVGLVLAGPIFEANVGVAAA